MAKNAWMMFYLFSNERKRGLLQKEQGKERERESWIGSLNNETLKQNT